MQVIYMEEKIAQTSHGLESHDGTYETTHIFYAHPITKCNIEKTESKKNTHQKNEKRTSMHRI